MTPELQPRVMSGILPSGRALARGWEQFIWGLEAALRKSEAGVMMWAKHKSHGDLVDAQPCADGRGMGGGGVMAREKARTMQKHWVPAGPVADHISGEFL